MGKQYTEIIVVGPLRLIKGFVHGYYLGKGVTHRPYFHLKSGTIRRDTLLGSLKTFFELENHVPFCMPTDMVDDFQKAAEVAHERFGISIKAAYPIKSAEVAFEHAIYNRDIAESCKTLFGSIPDGVEVLDYEPVERKHEDYAAMTMRGTAHSYEYNGKGRIKGDFEPVIDFFFKIKQSQCSELITCQDLALNLDKDNDAA